MFQCILFALEKRALTIKYGITLDLWKLIRLKVIVLASYYVYNNNLQCIVCFYKISIHNSNINIRVYSSHMDNKKIQLLIKHIIRMYCLYKNVYFIRIQHYITRL